MDKNKKIETLLGIYSPNIKFLYTPHVGAKTTRTPARAKCYMWDPKSRSGEVLASCYDELGVLGAHNKELSQKVVDVSYQIRQHVDSHLEDRLSDYEMACSAKLNKYLAEHPNCSKEDLEPLAEECTADLAGAKALLTPDEFRAVLANLIDKNLI